MNLSFSNCILQIDSVAEEVELRKSTNDLVIKLLNMILTT